MEEQKRDRLYELVRESCSGEPVRALLRKYRHVDSDIRIGDSVEQLYKYLERSHSKGIIPTGELINLLAVAEENGRQHIALYVPNDAADTTAINLLSDFDYISNALLQGKTPEEMGFPRFETDPLGSVVSDLRLNRVEGTEYSSWTFKIYQGKIKPIYKSREERENGEFALVYKNKPVRGTMVVRWHSYGLLEIRIDKDLVTGKTTYVEELGNCWDQIGVAVDRSLLKPLDLELACEALFEAASTTDYVSIGNPLAKDSDGNTHKVYQADPDQNFMKSSRAKDWRAMMTEFRQLAVKWIFGSKKSDKFPRQLGFTLRQYSINDIYIGSHASKNAIDFILLRIYRLATSSHSENIAQLTDEIRPSIMGHLSEKYPELKSSLDAIDYWLALHPSVDFLEPGDLVKALKQAKGINAVHLAETIGTLSQEGVLGMRYRARSHQTGTFLPSVYQSLRDVPDFIEDNFRVKHPIDDVDLIAVYEVLNQ